MSAGSETASFTSTTASASDWAGNATPDKDLALEHYGVLLGGAVAAIAARQDAYDAEQDQVAEAALDWALRRSGRTCCYSRVGWPTWPSPEGE